MSKQKRHLSTVVDIAKSVVMGVEVKTECGLTRQYRREDWEHDLSGAICADCFAAFNGAEDGAVIIQRRGWTDIAERALASLFEEKAARIRQPVVTTYLGTWTEGNGWTRVNR